MAIFLCFPNGYQRFDWPKKTHGEETKHLDLFVHCQHIIFEEELKQFAYMNRTSEKKPHQNPLLA